MLDAVCGVLGLQYSQILNYIVLHNENKEVKLKLQCPKCDMEISQDAKWILRKQIQHR